MAESLSSDLPHGAEYQELKQVITDLVGDLVRNDKLTWTRTTGASDLSMFDVGHVPLLGYYDPSFLIEMSHIPRREEAQKQRKGSDKEVETTVYEEQLIIQFFILKECEAFANINEMTEHLDAVSKYNFDVECFDHDDSESDLPERVDSKYTELFFYIPRNADKNLDTSWAGKFYGTASAQQNGDYQNALRVVKELKKIQSAASNDLENEE